MVHETDGYSSGGGRAGSDARSWGIRAFDADREAIAALLGRHHIAGRLDADEFEERIERCYAAMTLADLAVLLTDLPAAETGERRPRQEANGHRHAWRLTLAVLMVAALVVLAAFTGGHVLWLLWPLAFFVFGPFGRRWRGHRGRPRANGIASRS